MCINDGLQMLLVCYPCQSIAYQKQYIAIQLNVSLIVEGICVLLVTLEVRIEYLHYMVCCFNRWAVGSGSDDHFN